MGHQLILQGGPEMNRVLSHSISQVKNVFIFGIFHRGMFILVGMIMVVWTAIIICASALKEVTINGIFFKKASNTKNTVNHFNKYLLLKMLLDMWSSLFSLLLVF